MPSPIPQATIATEITPPPVDALAAALDLHEAGRLHDAALAYQQLLNTQPDHADALHLLGALRHQQGDQAVAGDLLRRAIALNPGVARYHSNLGATLLAQQDYTSAIAAFSQAIALQPTFADAHYNQGVAYAAIQQTEAAIDCFRQAILHQARHAPAHYNLALQYKRLGLRAEAAACLAQALVLKPNWPAAAFLYAALTGGQRDRAPADYVATLFDAYADEFDARLVDALGYKGPQQLLDLLHTLSDIPATPWHVLDLGCGTGLVGAVVAPYSAQLVGVDLSAKMLQKARASGHYQRLHQQDMLAMMQAEPTASYDLIVAADLLIYLGGLDEVTTQIQRLLRPGGCCLLSVEALEYAGIAADGADFRLLPSGRYAHAEAYLQALAAANGLTVRAVQQVTIRQEAGQPIAAWLMVWQGSDSM